MGKAEEYCESEKPLEEEDCIMPELDPSDGVEGMLYAEKSPKGG